MKRRTSLSKWLSSAQQKFAKAGMDIVTSAKFKHQ